MLLMGKMNPDSISVGRNDVRSAIWNATCCESAIVEIRSAEGQRAHQEERHAADAAQPRAAHRQVEEQHRHGRRRPCDEASEITKYGAVLPST